MDLVERQADLAERHPWEQSRARAIESVLSGAGVAQVDAILDYGCGDAYTGRVLLERFGARQLVGLDVNLTGEQCKAFAGDDPRISLTSRSEDLGDRRFDLVLLCDVIEHVEDDVELLTLAKSRLREEGGRIVVTVPAFQALFTDHDRMLKHYRRYSLAELESSVARAGLALDASGYLFGSLLPPRGMSKLLEVVRGPRGQAEGLGGWHGGKTMTRLLTAVLGADNRMLLALARKGVKLPGLSAWALCH